MIFFQNEWLSARVEPFHIAGKNSLARLLGLEGELVFGIRQHRSCREPDQIVGIGQGKRFIEVIDPPHQAAFLIPPSPEVFDVEVRDGEHRRSRHEVRADFRPDLNPAIEGGAQEGVGVLFHLLMLAEKVLLVNDRAGDQPRFITFGCFFNIQLGYLPS